MVNVFAYGTLMFPEVSRCLAGDFPNAQPATVSGYRRYEATIRSSGNFPYIVEDAEGQVEGILLPDVSGDQLARLDWFEEEGHLYHRRSVSTIQIAGQVQSMEVQLYVIGPGLRRRIHEYETRTSSEGFPAPWDPAHFRHWHLDWYLTDVVLPAVRQPGFVEAFGGPGDPDFVRQLEEKYAS